MTGREESRLARLAFWPIVFVAMAWVAGLGIWNLDQGLPHYLHPDELNVVGPVANTFEDPPDWNPHRFTYPTGFTYLHATLGRAWNALAGPKLGTDASGRLTAVRFGRGLCTAFASLTVLMLALAARLWFGSSAGLLAAGMTAASPLLVAQPHYTNVDTPLTFFLSMALWLTARASRSERQRELWALAVVIGLAAGTKYPGAYALVLPAALVAQQARRGDGDWGRAVLRLAGACAVAFVVFLITTPFAIIDFETFRSWFLYEADHAADLQLGWDLRGRGLIDRPYIYPLFAALPFAMGWVLWATGLVGLVQSLFRGRLAEGIVLALFITWMIGTGWAGTYFHRYALSMVPMWTLFAASWVGRARKGRERRVAVAMIGIGILYGAVMGASLISQMRPEPVVKAARWIEEHVQPGAKVLIASPTGGDNEFHALEDGHRFECKSLELGIEKLKREDPEIVLMNAWWSLAFRRYPEEHPEAIALLEYLEDPEGPFEVAARFESHFFTESAYSSLDRNFAAQFETPDMTVYRRR
ncbi:MAG: glycosyltransferase family 39 protein [Planctomycetota bacterium]